MDPRIPILLAGLESRRAELAAALGAAPPQLRTVSPGEGRWSVASVIEHLLQTEKGVIRLLAGMTGKAAARSAEETFDADAFTWSVEMTRFLDRSRRVTGSQPTGLMEVSEGWTALASSRKDLVAAVRAGDGLRLEDVAYPHPFAGDLDLYRWIAFIGLHEARHAAQIREIVAELEARR